VLVPDKLARVDSFTLAHVFEQSDPGGSNILRMQYMYACMDVADPQFVLMVLRYFKGLSSKCSRRTRSLQPRAQFPQCLTTPRADPSRMEAAARRMDRAGLSAILIRH
jgi:hypothetical protein